MENVWHKVTAWQRRDATLQQCVITLQAPPVVQDGYNVPGQYLHVHTPEGDSPFALASRPGEPLELLVKDSGSVARWLSTSPVDAPLEVTEVAGAGFYFDDVTPAHQVLLCGTGSGIAPLRPLLHALLDRGITPTLLYGGQHADTLAYRDEFLALAHAGRLRLELFVSQGVAEGAHRGGRIVDMLDADHVDAQRCIAFLCGVPAMVVEATQRLGALGVDGQRIRLNY